MERQRIGGEIETLVEMPGWHKPTGTETDAQTQGNHKATKPEKYTQNQAEKERGRYTVIHRPRQT